jgi:hypothetical protein
MSDCAMWVDCRVAGSAGCCRLGLYGGVLADGVCDACPRRRTAQEQLDLRHGLAAGPELRRIRRALAAGQSDEQIRNPTGGCNCGG